MKLRKQHGISRGQDGGLVGTRGRQREALKRGAVLLEVVEQEEGRLGREVQVEVAERLVHEHLACTHKTRVVLWSPPRNLGAAGAACGMVAVPDRQ